jgi:uncharacterized membrane protein YdfJ with MMPL/SSD domain
VLLDATLVRMVLVPATMALLGDRNWWMPSWLDRLVPRLSIESATPAVPALDDITPVRAVEDIRAGRVQGRSASTKPEA